MITTEERVLSTQEAAIHGGQKTIVGTASDRVLRMFEAIRTYGPSKGYIRAGSLLYRIIQDHGRSAIGFALGQGSNTKSDAVEELLAKANSKKMKLTV